MHAIHVSPRALVAVKSGFALIGAVALVVVGLVVISWSLWALNI